MSALRAPAPSEHESVGALVQRLGTDLTRIIRAETALLQFRATATLRVFKAAGGGLVAACVLAVVGLAVVMAGVVLILAALIPIWLAAFAVGGALLLVAAALAAFEWRVLTLGVNEALAPSDGPSAPSETSYGE